MVTNKGTKYYLQDVLNGINQKYMVRSFGELAKLVKPYHIELRQTKKESGRIGVAYGMNNFNPTQSIADVSTSEADSMASAVKAYE